ncbi:hypothetical protein FB451DRAFT_1176815 [Mycena latifolia]|nr:hypothetical protein FB451DRAFT_1176815 [Mycena latifolia]
MAASMPTQESYLVVGGGLPLGETIVDQLLGRGETRVSIFDALPLAGEQTGRFGDSVRVFVGDLLAPESISEAVKACGATCIIHAGMVVIPWAREAHSPAGPMPAISPAEVVKHHKEASELHRKINTDGMRNVLSAVLDSGTVTQLVYVGSADTVFDGRDRPLLRESDAPYPPKPWFSELDARSHGERMVLSFDGISSLRTAVVRPAFIYGPGYTATLRMIQGRPALAALQIGENTNRVDRTYVANIAHAALLAADRLVPAHPQHAATAGRAFFISDGDPRPFWDYTRALWVAAGGAPPAQPMVASRGVVMFIAAVKDMAANFKDEKSEAWKQAQFMCASRSYDISLAREVLGYAPIVGHDEGIRRTAEWWLETQLKLCRGKRAITEPAGDHAPPPYNREEATLLSEKSPFF